VDEEQHVVGDRALPGQDFRREEVHRRHNIQVVRMKSFQPTVFFRWGAGADGRSDTCGFASTVKERDGDAKEGKKYWN